LQIKNNTYKHSKDFITINKLRRLIVSTLLYYKFSHVFNF